jgi:biotin transport system substrate-specific component
MLMELTKANSQSKLIKSLIVIVLGSIALTVSAKLKIPFYPVPMTMQTFVVMFLSLSFGYKIGLATVGLYLLEGIVGFPVFSNSPEKGIGLVYFTGPTMGYLVGFLIASFLASFIKIKDNFLIIFLKLTMSVSTIYILGVLWLGILIGWDKPIIQLGVAPFLLAEIFKIALLTLLAKKIIKFRDFI